MLKWPCQVISPRSLLLEEEELYSHCLCPLYPDFPASQHIHPLIIVFRKLFLESCFNFIWPGFCRIPPSSTHGRQVVIWAAWCSRVPGASRVLFSGGYHLDGSRGCLGVYLESHTQQRKNPWVSLASTSSEINLKHAGEAFHADVTWE